jgi:hypothetical protein
VAGGSTAVGGQASLAKEVSSNSIPSAGREGLKAGGGSAERVQATWAE